MNVRAFIALKAPEVWQQELGRVQQALRKELRSSAFRWVTPEQIHITLRFFGSVASEEIATISQRISSAVRAVPAFELRLASLGCFPSAARPRVLWAGLQGGAAELPQLHSGINRETAEFGEPPDSRAFTAHLTLARIKEISRPEAQVLGKAIAVPPASPEPWRVSEVLLMRSELSPNGARYHVLSAHPLADTD